MYEQVHVCLQLEMFIICSISLVYSFSMVMRDIDSFHCLESRFISRGAAEGNKHGRAMETDCILK